MRFEVREVTDAKQRIRWVVIDLRDGSQVSEPHMYQHTAENERDRLEANLIALEEAVEKGLIDTTNKTNFGKIKAIHGNYARISVNPIKHLNIALEEGHELQVGMSYELTDGKIKEVRKNEKSRSICD